MSIKIADSALKARIDEYNRAMSRHSNEQGVRGDAAGDSPFVTGLASAFASMHSHQDGFDPSLSLAKARELEFKYAEVLREEFPSPNGFLFSQDSSVPAGARTHTVQRYYEAGEPTVYRAGKEIPKIDLGKGEESFNIEHYVIGDDFDIFAEMSAEFMDLNRAAEGLRVMRDALVRFANQMIWKGSAAHKLYGVLNYPWLRKFVSAQVFAPGQSTLAMVQELHRIANLPSNTSDNTFAPNAMFIGQRLYNFISTTPMSVDNSKSVLQTFLEQSPSILTVRGAWELNAAGPGGTDGILAYRDDRLGVQNVVVAGVTPLAPESRGFERSQYAYMTHGGVIMRDVLNNVLAFVEGPAA